jgi:Domain of unknown function (DUF4345)
MLRAPLEGGPVATRVFLGLSALLWIGFGLYCLFVPVHLAEAAGVTFTTPTGATDMRATYGGLTVAIGGLALAGALRDGLRRQALVLLASACAGLGGARLLGVALDGALTAWTVQGLVFELGTVALAVWLLRRA